MKAYRPLSDWVVVALMLNAALVAAVIVFALRIAARGPADFGVRSGAAPLERSATPATVVSPDSVRQSPPFSPADTRRVEWHALLDEYGRSPNVYLRAMRVLRASQEPRGYGALTRAWHDLAVAKQRLDRFEREMVEARHG